MAKRIVDEEMRFNIVINGDAAQKELYELETRNRKLTQSNKELKAERAKLFAEGKKNTQEYKRLSAEIKKNATEMDGNRVKMDALRKSMGVTGLTMGQLRAEATRLRLQLNNMVPGSSQYKKLEAELKSVNTRMAQLRAGSQATQGTLSKIAGGFNKFAALGASVVATMAGIVISMQKFIDYNKELSDAQADVQKTTGLTKKEVDDLTKSFGLFESRTSRINLLKIAEEGGRIGIAKDEIADFVQVMDKAVVALSDSFPGGVEETASKLGKLKLLFKETKDQSVEKAYNAIGSAINDLGAKGVATEANIAEFATRVGALPDSLKPNIAAALGLGAAFEESGIQAEIASRAYGIVLKQAATEGQKFAEVMGTTKQNVEDLINKDPLEFMIQFAKGLEGMNATETSQTLEYLGVSADGANKVLGAISNNTERFRELLDLSNKSMKEGTSLTNEFNVKNNNLAATIDKVAKRFQGLLSSDFLKNALTNVITGFGKLIGAIRDVDEELDREIKTTYESVKANRRLAVESQNLLDRYEELTKDGVDPTTEAKQELDEITLKLKDRLGDSVLAIDKETGAYILNTEAVREQIKLKRLAADDEASTLASRLVGAEEEIKALEKQQVLAEKEFETRKRIFKEANDGRGFSVAFANTSVPEFKETNAAFEATLDIQEKLNLQRERAVDLTQKLNDLNFNAADARNLIAPDPEEQPKEGEIKFVDGVAFIFTNGKWEVKRTFKPPGPTPPGAASGKDDTLEILRKNLDLKNQLIQDDFERELAILQTNHSRRIEDLKAQLKTTGKLTEEDIKRNGAIREQIRLEEEIFQAELGTLAEQSIEKDIKLSQEKYEREKQLRETAFNETLSSQERTLEEKERLQEEFNKAELQRQAQHVQELIDQIQSVVDAGSFEGIQLDLMSEEEQQNTLKFIEDLKALLAQLGVEIKAATQTSGTVSSFDDDFGDEVDLLGFSLDQWGVTFENLDTLEGKIRLAEMGVASLMQTWGQLNALATASDRKRLEDFKRTNDEQQKALEKRLDNGLISQRQYDQATDALDRQLRKKQAETEYKAARREKAMALASIALNTAIAVSKTIAQFGFPAALPWVIAVGALGAFQLGLALATPLPSKGYEKGFYGKIPVRREQDGKLFNADYGGESKSGMVKKPTMFLAGEQGEKFPELIISGPDLKRFDPAVTTSVANELRRIRGGAPGFEAGYTGPAVASAAGAATQIPYNQLVEMITANTMLLRSLEENGIIAYLSRDMRNTKLMQEDLERLNKYQNKSKVYGS